MRNLYESLKAGSNPIPVLVVPVSGAMNERTKDDIYNAIESIDGWVVLFDDAQEWCESNKFFLPG